ncbi:unnamed protein product [Cuscuta campestris]|uniref:Uncharacterized protein n=1 Tax=Cuscuta campestris TaxID=132261 RepID=A0A484LAQ6_9ASTE|nr:unnamed protein product [Cuscuta campestris]
MPHKLLPLISWHAKAKMPCLVTEAQSIESSTSDFPSFDFRIPETQATIAEKQATIGSSLSPTRKFINHTEAGHHRSSLIFVQD